MKISRLPGIRSYAPWAGAAIVAVFIFALTAVVWNLQRLQKDQVGAYQALAGNLSQTAMSFIIEKQSGNMFEFMAVLSRIPSIRYLAYWTGERCALRAGNAAGLDAHRLGFSQADTAGTQAGRFLYYDFPLPQHQAVFGVPGSFQIVFSLDELLSIKRNILAASVLSGAVLAVLVLLFLQLNRVHAQLKAAQRQKSEMISAISHDANGYLTVVKGKLDNLLLRLRRNLKLEDPEAHLALAAEYAEALARLLENLKDYENLVEGKMPVVPANERLAPLLESVRRGAEDEARRRRQSLALEDGAADVVVRADALLLRRVLQNLVSNALKFSPEGSAVRLRVESGEKTVRILVADEGPGIPRAAWSRVFEPYVRLQTAVKGTGLGLAIARSLMRLMGGELAVASSAPDTGTIFAASLPRSDESSPLGGDNRTGD
jgi:signal transduction histidine kinase